MAKWLASLLVLISLSFGVEIVSNKLITDREGNVVAEGEVEAEYRDYIIKADRIKYNPRTKEVFAYGRVYIKKKDGSLEVVGDQAYLNLKTERGYFIDAEGKFRKFYFRAERIEKISKDLYRVEKGEITTCPPDKRDVRVCFWKARISDRYVFSFSNSLKFFSIPIAYSPLVIFPVGERRSGLLPPMIGSTTYNDFIYIQPFYWAISEDKDTTLTFDYRDKQAKGGSLEYRQAFTLKERLYFKLSYYREPFPPGEWWNGRKLKTFRENRYRIEFNLGFRGWKLGLDLPSDPYFLEDVYFSRKERTKPFTLSYITYTRLEKDYLLSFNLRNYYDLISGNNKQTLNLLPEFGFYSRPKKVGLAYLNLTTTFTNFYRDGGLRAKRLLFMPQAELPMRIFSFQNYVSVKLLNNLYFIESIDGNQRYTDDKVISFYLEDRFPMFYTFSYRSFNFSNVLELVYTFSPENFNNPQFDSFDIVTKENNFKLRLKSGVSYRNRSVMNLFLEGGYNILESYRFPTDAELIERKLLPARAILSLYPTKWLTITEDMTYDANLGIVARSISSASLNIKNSSFGASYISSRNSRNERIADQYMLSGEINLKGIILGASTTRDNITNKEFYRKLYLGYNGACWALKIDYKRTYYREKGYIQEIFIILNIFNLKDLKLPLRRR